MEFNLLPWQGLSTALPKAPVTGPIVSTALNANFDDLCNMSAWQVGSSANPAQGHILLDPWGDYTYFCAGDGETAFVQSLIDAGFKGLLIFSYENNDMVRNSFQFCNGVAPDCAQDWGVFVAGLVRQTEQYDKQLDEVALTSGTVGTITLDPSDSIALSPIMQGGFRFLYVVHAILGVLSCIVGIASAARLVKGRRWGSSMPLAAMAILGGATVVTRACFSPMRLNPSGDLVLTNAYFTTFDSAILAMVVTPMIAAWVPLLVPRRSWSRKCEVALHVLLFLIWAGAVVIYCLHLYARAVGEADETTQVDWVSVGDSLAGEGNVASSYLIAVIACLIVAQICGAAKISRLTSKSTNAGTRASVVVLLKETTLTSLIGLIVSISVFTVDGLASRNPCSKDAVASAAIPSWAVEVGYPTTEWEKCFDAYREEARAIRHGLVMFMTPLALCLSAGMAFRRSSTTTTSSSSSSSSSTAVGKTELFEMEAGPCRQVTT